MQCHHSHPKQQPHWAASEQTKKQQQHGPTEKEEEGQDGCPKCNPSLDQELPLCVMHGRMKQMRSDARSHRKAVPAESYLERLLKESLKNGFLCPHCKSEMGWKLKDAGRATVTLQHDREGGLRLLCLRCNVRHSFHEGDRFYEDDGSSKLCGGCNLTLPLHKFGKIKSKNRPKPRCKECTRRYKRLHG